MKGETRRDFVSGLVAQVQASNPIPVRPALQKAADAAWAAYASCCRWGGVPAERALSYAAARQAEQRVWQAAGHAAARCEP
jgi:hypothetical protein